MFPPAMAQPVGLVAHLSQAAYPAPFHNVAPPQLPQNRMQQAQARAAYKNEYNAKWGSDSQMNSMEGNKFGADQAVLPATTDLNYRHCTNCGWEWDIASSPWDTHCACGRPASIGRYQTWTVPDGQNQTGKAYLETPIRLRNWDEAIKMFTTMAKESKESSRAAQEVFEDVSLAREIFAAQGVKMQESLALGLQGYVAEFMKHQHANFVMEMVLRAMPKRIREVLMAEIRGVLHEDQSGRSTHLSCVLAKHRTAERSIKLVLDDEGLAKELFEELDELIINNEFRNVLCYALECMPDWRSKIVETVVNGRQKKLLQFAAEQSNKEFVQNLFYYCDTMEQHEVLTGALLDNDFSKLLVEGTPQDCMSRKKCLLNLNLQEVGCGHIQDRLNAQIASATNERWTNEVDEMPTTLESMRGSSESASSFPQSLIANRPPQIDVSFKEVTEWQCPTLIYPLQEYRCQTGLVCGYCGERQPEGALVLRAEEIGWVACEECMHVEAGRAIGGC